MDTAFGAVIQRRFSGEGKLGSRWNDSVGRGIAALEGTNGVLTRSAEPDMGDLAIAVGLSYTEFRMPEIKWRAGAPRLAEWFEGLEARPSMKRSAPE